MIISIKSIERIGAGTYRVTHEEDEGTTRREFVFSVVGDEIPVVQSPSEFERYVNLEVWRVTPLLNAVLSFHLAQRLSIPDS